MSRNISFDPMEFYHIYNRGTEKRVIFSSRADYERFIALLYLCNSKENIHLNNYPRLSLDERLLLERADSIVNIGAYCLMPNHFHLIMQEKENGGISRFMQKITTGYTMYFNKRNERTGALFQGKFKATYVKNDEYLKYLISYIHLNPIKLVDPRWKENGLKNRKRAEDFLNQYTYSTYIDYCGERRLEGKIINKYALPKYFSSSANFKSVTQNWLEYNSSTEVEPR